MSFLNNIEFVNPWLLLLLFLIPLLGIWYFFTQKRRFSEIYMPSLEGLDGIDSIWTKLTILLPILRCLALAMFIIALARPQSVLQEEEITADGIDINLVMDLSSSMLAQDFKPDRLEASKKVAADFISKRPYDRIGLVVFAGESYTQCPLTSDHRVLQEFLAGLQCGVLEDGTAIGMGLATAVNRIKDSKAKSKVIILLTDGVNNSGYIKPIQAAEIAKVNNIRVYTIGVGTQGDALAPVRKRNDGQYIFGLVPVEIDEELLVKIAEMTQGKYFRATTLEGLEQIYQYIDALEKTKQEITVIKRYSEEFPRFLILGLIFIILELILRYTVLRTIP